MKQSIEKDWRDMYPLDTFHGKTKDELICFIESILENQARLFIEEIKKRHEQLIAVNGGKLPFAVWMGKADEVEKATIYEQAVKDNISIITSLSGIKAAHPPSPKEGNPRMTAELVKKMTINQFKH